MIVLQYLLMVSTKYRFQVPQNYPRPRRKWRATSRRDNPATFNKFWWRYKGTNWRDTPKDVGKWKRYNWIKENRIVQLNFKDSAYMGKWY